MRIDTYAQLQQVRENGGYVTLDRQGRLATQSRFMHLMQKIADVFRSLSRGGYEAVQARRARLAAAMDAVVRQGTVINPARTEIPRPARRPDVVQPSLRNDASVRNEASVRPEHAVPSADANGQIMAEVYAMAEAELSGRFPEVAEETRGLWTLEVSERMREMLQSSGGPDRIDAGVLNELVLGVLDDVIAQHASSAEVLPETVSSEGVQAFDAVQDGGNGSPAERVENAARGFVNRHFAMLPQRERAEVVQHVAARLADAGRFEAIIRDQKALSEVVEAFARKFVQKKAVQNIRPYAGLRAGLYADPESSQSMPLLHLRAMAGGMSPEGQIRADIYAIADRMVRRLFPGADDQNYVGFILHVREHFENMVDQLVQSDESTLRGLVEDYARTYAADRDVIDAFTLKEDVPDRIVSRDAMRTLTQQAIKPDTILSQGSNACFMVSVLNSMLTTEQGRAMLASRLTESGTMPLDGAYRDTDAASAGDFTALERSLGAAYQKRKDPGWTPGNMGIATEFAALFGMKEVQYQSFPNSVTQGIIAGREDAEIIRRHLEEGHMVLLYRLRHYRAVVGVEGDTLILCNSMYDGREEHVRISELVRGAINVMAYPEA